MISWQEKRENDHFEAQGCSADAAFSSGTAYTLQPGNASNKSNLSFATGSWVGCDSLVASKFSPTPDITLDYLQEV
ncbi:MAG: hypothetical protein AB3A66_12700 [Nodularia sp. CChRGM 3473]